MLKEILDNLLVKKSILTFVIGVALVIVISNIIFAVKLFIIGNIISAILKVLTCVIWSFIGGCAVYIVHRDFIRKQKKNEEK
jgi:hypothetical protein